MTATEVRTLALRIAADSQTSANSRLITYATLIGVAARMERGEW